MLRRFLLPPAVMYNMAKVPPFTALWNIFGSRRCLSSASRAELQRIHKLLRREKRELRRLGKRYRKDSLLTKSDKASCAATPPPTPFQRFAKARKKEILKGISTKVKHRDSIVRRMLINEWNEMSDRDRAEYFH